ncbi:MAG: acyl carrier protein [Oscillospiraceae bacterium]|jgi:acyl carrier protein|nr:acyl carrier protein [Oscillospiraceae bacterium]
MEELLEILQDINPDVDYETEDNLIDGKVLDSLSIIQMINEICETFDIEIGPKWMRNENFNSAQKIWDMIQAIREEE